MMSASKLSKEMLDLFRANMKAMNPKAKPTEYQEVLTKAISAGVVDTLSKATAIGATPAPIATGINGIGLIVMPDIMQQAAMTKMVSETKSKGEALDLILQSVMVPIAKHLAEAVEVVSTSGFGGQALPPEVPDSLISANIIKNLPTDIASNMAKSKYGMTLINSVAFGIAAGLKTSIPGIVPFGSVPPPPGLLAATFK